MCFLNSVTRKEGGGPEGLVGRDQGLGMSALHVESAGSTGKVWGELDLVSSIVASLLAGSCQAPLSWGFQ